MLTSKVNSILGGRENDSNNTVFFRKSNTGNHGNRRKLRPRIVTYASMTRSEVLLVDNYDSFTYNLSQYLGQLGCPHRVVKNDELTVDEIKTYALHNLVLSNVILCVESLL